jgi:hypothetical protein
VEEVDPGGGVNTCCEGFGCHKSIRGGNHWTVGDNDRPNDTYGPDTVGLILPLVQTYQDQQKMFNKEPCGYVIGQIMVADLPEGPFEFVRNLQLYLINKTEVACAKVNQKDRRGASMTVPSRRETEKTSESEKKK